jgi:5-hydroxyisourate hydrolase
MSGLTTHVLDLVSGLPAAGIGVRLHRTGEASALLFSGVADADGRCRGLLGGQPLTVGRYRLEFDVAAYFRARGVAVDEPAFLDVVEIGFGVADPDRHHHVPLLVSPYGYSTYRGS